MIHTLPPSITYVPSGRFSARVRSANASLPLPGSDRQKQPTADCASSGNAKSHTAGEPHFLNTLFTSVFCTSTITATDASRFEISSIARHDAIKDASAPP